MKTCLWIVIFLVVSSDIKSQLPSSASGYTFCDWDKITLKPDYSPVNGDTAIVFVSTRNYFPDREAFMDYGFDTSKTLHCFTVYFNRNKWICVPRKNLEEAITDNSKREFAVVYVEGNGKTFTGSIDRATRLTRAYNVLTIYFDWPTFNQDLRRKGNYKATMAMSKVVAKPFSDFLQQLFIMRTENKVEYKSLCLFMHSMGNLLVKHSVEKKYISERDTLFSSIVINAACLPLRHHTEWVEKLKAGQVYIMRNRSDKTLRGAKLLTFKRQLGESSGKPFAKNALYIDLTGVLQKQHNYFLYSDVLRQNPDIKKVYSTVFHGGSPVFDDPKKYKKAVKKNEIDFISPNLPKKRDIGLSISTF